MGAMFSVDIAPVLIYNVTVQSEATRTDHKCGIVLIYNVTVQSEATRTDAQVRDCSDLQCNCSVSDRLSDIAETGDKQYFLQMVLNNGLIITTINVSRETRSNPFVS